MPTQPWLPVSASVGPWAPSAAPQLPSAGLLPAAGPSAVAGLPTVAGQLPAAGQLPVALQLCTEQHDRLLVHPLATLQAPRAAVLSTADATSAKADVAPHQRPPHDPALQLPPPPPAIRTRTPPTSPGQRKVSQGSRPRSVLVTRRGESSPSPSRQTPQAPQTGPLALPCQPPSPRPPQPRFSAPPSQGPQLPPLQTTTAASQPQRQPRSHPAPTGQYSSTGQYSGTLFSSMQDQRAPPAFSQPWQAMSLQPAPLHSSPFPTQTAFSPYPVAPPSSAPLYPTLQQAMQHQSVPMQPQQLQQQPMVIVPAYGMPQVHAQPQTHATQQTEQGWGQDVYQASAFPHGAGAAHQVAAAAAAAAVHAIHARHAPGLVQITPFSHIVARGSAAVAAASALSTTGGYPAASVSAASYPTASISTPAAYKSKLWVPAKVLAGGIPPASANGVSSGAQAVTAVTPATAAAPQLPRSASGLRPTASPFAAAAPATALAKPPTSTSAQTPSGATSDTAPLNVAVRVFSVPRSAASSDSVGLNVGAREFSAPRGLDGLRPSLDGPRTLFNGQRTSFDGQASPQLNVAAPEFSIGSRASEPASLGAGMPGTGVSVNTSSGLPKVPSEAMNAQVKNVTSVVYNYNEL